MAKRVALFPSKLEIPELEKSVLEFWKKDDTFKKSVDQRPLDKQYVFYDGPPFATGMPHAGHLLGSTSKDLIPRYWTMKGYRVERIWGWDCHGLPIENMIEGQLNLKGGKKQIEELGIDVFNQACRSEVLRLDSEWERVIERIGRWVDFDNNYKTMDTSYMESVWWGFQQMNEKGLVYEGKKVILYCPRCSTPLSNFEIAMDNSYSTVTDWATTYKYKVVGQENTYLLAWSTTPWNKLATPALAVNPDLQYVTVEQNGEKYILAESRLSMLHEKPEYKVVEKHLGSELTALKFEPHYDFYPNRTENERIGVLVADSFVTDDEGTGVVTLAVYGEDDYRVMQKENIQIVEHVDDEGKLKPEVKPWAGMFILKVNDKVNEDLEARNLIYANVKHTHSVGECYRCKTRLYYAPLPAWFIDIQKLKPDLIAANENISWYPGHLKHGRFGKGLETAPDWNISRSRYWGTPIPIWRSKEGQDRVIGSIEELKRWAVDQEAAKNVTDIHRENIDSIEVWVDDAKTIVGRRVPEVFDCWVESGSMPYASRHYPFENKELFEKTYPAQFVSEYIAQTRAWFYTMHVISVAIFGGNAVENTLTTGTIMAADGSKMSKSKRNFTDPMEIVEKMGADSFRLYLMSSPVMRSENINFNEKEISDIRKKVFVIWYNCLSFYKLYRPSESLSGLVTTKPKHILDRWILSRTHTLISEITEALDNYDTVSSSRQLMAFITEISTWYLRRSRDRFRVEDNQEGLDVFGTVLALMSQLFAPVAPFFSEFVHSQVVDADGSVHLTDWPEALPELQDQKLESDMTNIRVIVEKVHAARAEAGIKLRQPLAKIQVTAPYAEADPEVIQVLLDEINVKEVIWTKEDNADLSVVLDTVLTPDLEAEGQARELIRNIQVLRKQSGLGRDDAATVSVPSIPEKWQKEIELKTKVKLVLGDEMGLVAKE